MNSLQKIHKLLLYGLGGSLVFFLLIYVFILRSREAELEQLKAEVEDLQNGFAAFRLPMDADQLQAYLAKLKQDAKGSNTEFKASFAEAVKRTNATFAEHLSKYQNTEAFMREATRVVYMGEYANTMRKFKYIKFDQDLLGLKDDMPAGTPMYQCFMQLWTLDRLLSIAADSDLEVCTVQENGRMASADVSVKEPIPYVLSAGNEKPYLLEFPVVLSLQGGLQECVTFLNSLNTEDVFIPVTGFEIFGLPPSQNGTKGNIRMKLQCSSFLYLEQL